MSGGDSATGSRALYNIINSKCKLCGNMPSPQRSRQLTSTPTDADVLRLVVRLRAVVGPLVRQLRLQASEPLSFTELSALGSIRRYGPISLGDLAARERLSPPMISRVVTGLEEHAFVTRSWDRFDRRVCRVQLSSAGERWMEEGETQQNRWLAGRLASLQPDELALVAAGLAGLEQLISLDVDQESTGSRRVDK
jgi:DNA-binding MarR family transcriptional regulator